MSPGLLDGDGRDPWMTPDPVFPDGEGTKPSSDAPADAPRPKIGLVGYGRWGQTWAKVLNSEDMLHWVVDTDPKMQAKARYDYEHVTVHGEVPLWELPYTDGVVVATPPEHHAEPTLLALSHDVPVLVEKPMALDPADAGRMVAMAEERNVRLMVDHTFLAAAPVWQAAKHVRGSVGDVAHGRYVWQNVSTARDEDALWNLAPHPLSISLYLARLRETDVAHWMVNAFSTRRSGTVDCVDLSLFMEDGSADHIHVANFGPEKVREFTVLGTRGSVVCRPTQREAILSPYKGTRIFYQKAGDQPLRTMLRAFVDPGKLQDEHGTDALAQVEILSTVSEEIRAMAARAAA